MNPKTKPFVVLLHGLFRTRYSMWLLDRDLKRSGYRTINYGYPSRRYSIAEHARRLNQVLLQRVGEQQKISFVTHSLGSIVLRRLISDCGSRHNFQRAVMLGPPNLGSQFAARIRGIPLIAYILGPSFLELCERTPASCPQGIEVGIIAGGRNNDAGFSPWINGDNDGIVAVSETYMEGAQDHKVFPVLHSVIMYSKQVRNEVLYFLETGRFMRPNIDAVE